MRTLTLISGRNFVGKTKPECIQKLLEYLRSTDDIVEDGFESEYKCYASIITIDHLKDTYGANDYGQAANQHWGIEVFENGAGEYRWFDSKEDMIAAFCTLALASGEHWD